MNRRTAIQKTSLLVGTSIIGAQAFISGCVENKHTAPNFSENHFKLIEEISEIIVPATSDSGGAKVAQVAQFINEMVFSCYSKEEQEIFISGLAELEDRIRKEYKASFNKLSPEDQSNFVHLLDMEAVGESNTTCFTMLKQMTILGYFNSELGVKQALRYDPSPGRYDGCHPYNSRDKAWYGPLSSIG